MSLTLSFDTLAYVKQLKEGLKNLSGKRALRIGMGCKAQSTAIADAIASICNTADRPSPQMHAARRVIQTFPKAQEQATARVVEQLDTKTEKAIALLHKDIALMRKDMEFLRKDIILKMGGMFMVAVGIIVTVLFRLLK